jgi:hypothetical protein
VFISIFGVTVAVEIRKNPGFEKGLGLNDNLILEMFGLHPLDNINIISISSTITSEKKLAREMLAYTMLTQRIK